MGSIPYAKGCFFGTILNSESAVGTNHKMAAMGVRASIEGMGESHGEAFAMTIFP